MKMDTILRRTGLTVGLLALSLGVAACGPGSGSGSSGKDDKSISLGIIPSWTDGLSTAYLWQAVLQDEGYDVDITEIPDAAPLFTGVSKGDVDIYPSAWPEVTHAAYMDQYGDKLEDLGAYYDNAKLTFAVPEYMDIDSIEDLKGQSDRFDGKITGIEAGAGLTKATKDNVIPQYGLDKDGYSLVESSTTAMLAELKKAVADKDDIVVTLWRPFWANSEFPVKDLKDPKGALGEAETLNAVATKGFSDKHPEVAEMFANFKLDDDEYGSLEDMVVNEYGEGNEAEAVQAWLKKNPDFIDSLKG